MKKTLSILFFIVLSLGSIFYTLAQETKPLILLEPEDWRYEKIDFPLDFAPELDYQGFEELRFAPDMFNTSKDDYFTYVFAISIDNKTKFKKKELQQFLISYYKGLCDAVAKSKKLSVDLSKISVDLQKSKKRKKNSKSYNSQVLFLDTFNNGKEVLLNMEIEIVRNKSDKSLILLALVSPKDKTEKIWNELLDIRKTVNLNFTNNGVKKEVEDGSSFEKAIVVNSIAEEYEYVKKVCVGCQILGQSLLHKDKVPYDVLRLKNGEGKTVSYYFDISKFFGKGF